MKDLTQINNYSILEAFDFYLGQGLVTIPLHSKSKKPAISSWQTSTLEDAYKFRSMLLENKTMNLGLLTGARNNIDVLDIDKKSNGYESFKTLTEEHKVSFPKDIVVKTGGGGLHLYFKHHIPNLKNRVSIFEGIDLKCDKGFVVCPPSTHENGMKYEFINYKKEVRDESL